MRRVLGLFFVIIGILGLNVCSLNNKEDRNIQKQEIYADMINKTSNSMKGGENKKNVLKEKESTIRYYRIEEFGGGVSNIDNSTALKIAIDELNGTNSVILFGSGTYCFESNVVIDYPISNISIQGISQSCTYFNFKTICDLRTPMMVFNDTVSEFSVENITAVLGEREQEVESTNSLLYFKNLSTSYIANLCLNNLYGGIEIEHFSDIVIDNVMMLHIAMNEDVYGFILGDEESSGLVLSRCSVDGLMEQNERKTYGCCIINGGSEIYVMQNDFCNFGEGYGIYYYTNEMQNNIFLIQNDIMRVAKGVTVTVNGCVSEFVSCQNNYFAYGDDIGDEWYAFYDGIGKLELIEIDNSYYTQNKKLSSKCILNINELEETSYIEVKSDSNLEKNNIKKNVYGDNGILNKFYEKLEFIENNSKLREYTLSAEMLYTVFDKNIYIISDYVHNEMDDAGIVIEEILNSNPYAYIIVDKNVNMYTACDIKRDVYCNIAGKKLDNGEYPIINYMGEEEFAFAFLKNYQWGMFQNISLDCNGKSGIRFDGLLYKGGVMNSNIVNAFCAVDIGAFAYCYFEKIYISADALTNGARLFCWDKKHASSQQWLNEFAYVKDILIDGHNAKNVIGMYNDTGTFQYFHNIEIHDTTIGILNENTSEVSDNNGGIWNFCNITNCNYALAVGTINKYMNIGSYNYMDIILAKNGKLLYIVPQDNICSCIIEMNNLTLHGDIEEQIVSDEGNVLWKEISNYWKIEDSNGIQVVDLW